MYNSRVEISKSALLHNLLQFQKIAGKKVQIMPIVKSNAYGHGLIQVAKLISPKVKWLGVVSLGEALELKKHQINNRIFVLSYAQSRYLAEGIRQGIELPVYDLPFAKLISRTAKKIKKTARVHIKIDTGTSRIGILTSQAVSFIKKVDSLPNLEIVGIYSHFASSEENPKFTRLQLDRFNQIIKELENSNIDIAYKHFACSAAILTQPQSYFNLARLGLGLYGLWPSKLAKTIALQHYPGLKLKPVLTWKTKIVQIKTLPKGTAVGYGETYRTKKETKVATLACGYWEGYDRKLSNNSFVQIKNKKCPVIGRVCMNLMMVDVSSLKSVKAGDEAVLLGGQVPAEFLAERIGTINYEVVTRINPLLPRVLIK